LPAPSGMLPDGFSLRIAKTSRLAVSKTGSGSSRQHAANNGQNARAPRLSFEFKVWQDAEPNTPESFWGLDRRRLQHDPAKILRRAA